VDEIMEALNIALLGEKVKNPKPIALQEPSKK